MLQLCLCMRLGCDIFILLANPLTGADLLSEERTWSTGGRPGLGPLKKKAMPGTRAIGESLHSSRSSSSPGTHNRCKHNPSQSSRNPYRA